MKPLEIKPQSKMVEEVKIANSKVGTEPLVVIHDLTFWLPNYILIEVFNKQGKYILL
jgi:hypothetical protein